MSNYFLFGKEKVYYSPFWEYFLQDKIVNMLQQINRSIGKDFTPGKKNIFRFMLIENIKCIILGLDPYPQQGAATGRAFEVADAELWQDRSINASLRNILKLLYRSYNMLSVPPAIETVRKDIDFPIMPPRLLFDDWEKQGVLLLNAALTCKIGVPGSHSVIWQPFINEAISFIYKQVPHAVWFLWGTKTHSYRSLLGEKARIHLCSHPSARNNSFLTSNCFIDTWDEFNWLGCCRRGTGLA